MRPRTLGYWGSNHFRLFQNRVDRLMPGKGASTANLIHKGQAFAIRMRFGF